MKQKINEDLGRGKMKQIKTLEQLYALVLKKKAVVSTWGKFTHKHMPAAFIINLSGAVLMNMFHNGLYEYKRRNK